MRVVHGVKNKMDNGRKKASKKVVRRAVRRQGKTITFDELKRLSFCNSQPRVVNVLGHRKIWVGIGWIDDGPARGGEVVVVD